MTKRYTARQTERKGRANRESALARIELGYGTSLRDSAAGPTSMAVKQVDNDTRRLVDDFIAKRQKPNGG